MLRLLYIEIPILDRYNVVYKLKFIKIMPLITHDFNIILMHIFRSYFRHVMAINSTVWQCEATGKDGLTYEEAVKSERIARKKMEQFKQSLRAPVLLVIEHARQSAVKTLNMMVSKFLRKRFFLNEEVTVVTKRNTVYKVVGIMPGEKVSEPGNGIYEDTEQLEYRLRAPNGDEICAPFDQLRRQRTEFNQENLAMFIKNNVIRVDGILRPKPDTYKQYVTEPNASFSKIFIGKMPRYSPAKIKRPEAKDTKKQSTLNKYIVKGEESTAKSKVNAEARAKLLADEMERVRLEKIAKCAEMEQQKAQKKAELMLRVEQEFHDLTAKTDDLERSDHSVLPTYHPIVTFLPDPLLGDVFMLREFMHTYRGLLSGVEVFRQNLSFYEMSRAFSAREVAGPLSDILLVLLGTIFDLQKEEEEECPVRYSVGRKPFSGEPYNSMYDASRTHHYCKRHFSFNLSELPLDALTLSEVLRLHLLSSGAAVQDKPEKWRVMYRNGYSSIEDPGLQLRLQHTHILRALKTQSVAQLDFADILRVINCLMAQILTYSGTINVIEERMERTTKAKSELRALSIIENKRLAALEMAKRKLTNEHHQQCLSDDIKQDAEKKQALGEQLNRRIADLVAQSDREQRKHDQQVLKLHSELFNFLVYLGMDRCYRKYYVLESMPGIFIEHMPDTMMDTCLAQPPVNKSPAELRKQAQLPKVRKDLRIYLVKLYSDDDKKKRKPSSKQSLENKENQENRLNGHGQGPSTENMEVGGGEDEVQSQPTQFELLMCSGDSTNCIVHSEQHAQRKVWSYIYQPQEIDALIRSLNPLGLRESELLDELTQMRALIEQHVKNCPQDMLSLDTDKKRSKFISAMQAETQRKYSLANFGLPEGTELNEVLRLHLVDCILQFESDIYTGDLGKLKVKDMEKWRQQLLQDNFDAQTKLQWGPGQIYSDAVEVDSDNESHEDYDDHDDENKDAYSQYTKKRYGKFVDPGQYIENEDSSSTEPEMQQTQVRNLASALLQVEQAIGRRFLKEPFGITKKRQDSKLEQQKFICELKLHQWEISLMESTSYAQVFLHLSILHDSILWNHSTNKSLCKVCRRRTDPDKMLLCDQCNGGTHMFCMKPKMRTVPEGNWYCHTCVKNLGLTNASDDKQQEQNKRAAKKKRKFIVDEVDDDVDEGVADNDENDVNEDDDDGDNFEEAELSDDPDDKSVSSSTSVKAKGKAPVRSSGRRSSKRLKSKEIEDAIEEDDDEADNESSVEADENETEDENEEEETYVLA